MQDTEKIRILIVEDNRIAQKVARVVVESLNCEYDITDNGISALELFRENRYDLVFMDLGLPGKSGLCVAAEIRDMEKALSMTTPIPIIGLSVHTGQEPRNDALNAGMNDYLVKPLTVKSCRAILNKFLPLASLP